VVCTNFCTTTVTVPDVKPNKTLTLSGTLCNTSTSSTMTGTKILSVSPALSGDDSYSVNLCIETCDRGNTSNIVRLYCNNVALSPYYLNNNAICCRCVCLNYGDTLSYDMASTLTNTSLLQGCGCASIKIINGVSGSFNPIVGAASCKKTTISMAATTTTTTTTAAPTITYISFNTPTIVCNTDTIKSYYTTLKTSKPLTSNQSFGLTLNTCANIDEHAYTLCPICSSASYSLNNTTLFSGNVALSTHSFGCCSEPYCATSNITVNSTNINNYRFCVCVVNNPSNEFYCNSGTILITNIYSQCGGIFVLDSCGYRNIKAELVSDNYDVNYPYPGG
jgi:hypothetical protein